MGEFDLIARYFTRPQTVARIGIGDDCAIVSSGPEVETCITSDLLIQGHHFLPEASPEALGHKALAVNFSDLAAMGAKPVSFLLSLGLPHTEEAWLAAFARGLFALADQHNCQLIGGDTTGAPIIVINITAFGSIPQGGGVLRSGAQVGDDIWVSGTLGDASLALALRKGQMQADSTDAAQCFTRMDRPTPRVDLGIALATLANSMMDLSDGLAGDLPHILKASGVSADVELTALPVCPAVAKLAFAQRVHCAASGGDDYELLFTAASARRAHIQQIAQQQQVALTHIGSILPMLGPKPVLRWLENGQLSTRKFSGFQHFTESNR